MPNQKTEKYSKSTKTNFRPFWFRYIFYAPSKKKWFGVKKEMLLCARLYNVFIFKIKTNPVQLIQDRLIDHIESEQSNLILYLQDNQISKKKEIEEFFSEDLRK